MFSFKYYGVVCFSNFSETQHSGRTSSRCEEDDSDDEDSDNKEAAHSDAENDDQNNATVCIGKKL